MGTFGGALEARQIPAGDGKLSAEARGEVELDGKVLVIRRIHVQYRLEATAAARAAAERVHEIHKEHCPVYRSIGGCIAMTTALTLVPAEGDGA